MNHSQQDELAQLFAQNMQLSQQAAQQQQARQMQQGSAPVQSVHQIFEKEQHAGEPQIAYISSHYTGTAHVRPTDVTSEPSRSPPPPYNEAFLPEAMAETLRQNSVEPAALLPNQIHLFLNADYEQRLRLLELWRIAPPSYPSEEHVNGAWVSTSVEREEDLARARYEQQQQRSLQQENHRLDKHIANGASEAEPMSPIREVGEPAWPPAARLRAASIAASKRQQGEAEDYMVNGYSGHKQSVDPVYAAAAELWQAPSYAEAVRQEEERQQMMENQYGMLEQIRNHADWERMNEQSARERMEWAYRGGSGGDEDMEL